MDRLRSLELFVCVVDRASFSTAAIDLGISRPVATETIKVLEERSDTRLLRRSMRHVQPTVEGKAHYRCCVATLADVEDADRAVSGIVARMLRIDVVGNLVRRVLLRPCPTSLHGIPRWTSLSGRANTSWI